MYVKTAPRVLGFVYFIAVLIIFGGIAAGRYAYAAVSASVLLVSMVYQLLSTAAGTFLPPYDMEIIRKSFPLTPLGAGGKLMDAVSCIHRGEDSEALELLGSIKEGQLDVPQQASVSFYQSICYNRMGYPTNAGRCAAEAADNGICLPESMLMAARNFYMAGSLGEAREYYEKLLPMSEEKMVFPFVFNELGRVYISSQMGEEAQKAFERSLEIGFAPTVSEGGMALACLLQKKHDEACEWYRLALMSHIEDDDGFKEFAAQVCRAAGLPEDFLDVHLREKYAPSVQNGE